MKLLTLELQFRAQTLLLCRLELQDVRVGSQCRFNETLLCYPLQRSSQAIIAVPTFFLLEQVYKQILFAPTCGFNWVGSNPMTHMGRVFRPCSCLLLDGPHCLSWAGPSFLMLFFEPQTLNKNTTFYTREVLLIYLLALSLLLIIIC